MDQPRVPAGNPRGGQWTSTRVGGGTSAISRRGDWQEDPLQGERPGHHTPEAMKRLISYLEKESGETILPHGSVKTGKTSMHDFDLIVKSPDEKDLEKVYYKAMEEDATMYEKMQNGVITEDQYTAFLTRSPNTTMTLALEKIGFKLTREMGFSEAIVSRYVRQKTKHTVEMWRENHGGSVESGPRMFSIDYDPNTGKIISQSGT